MNRRGFIRGLVSALAAPAVVRAELLMPISALHIPSDIEIHNYSVLPTYWSYEELAAATQRAFVPRLVVQIMNQLSPGEAPDSLAMERGEWETIMTGFGLRSTK